MVREADRPATPQPEPGDSSGGRPKYGQPLNRRQKRNLRISIVTAVAAVLSAIGLIALLEDKILDPIPSGVFALLVSVLFVSVGGIFWYLPYRPDEFGEESYASMLVCWTISGLLAVAGIILLVTGIFK